MTTGIAGRVSASTTVLSTAGSQDIAASSSTGVKCKSDGSDADETVAEDVPNPAADPVPAHANTREKKSSPEVVPKIQEVSAMRVGLHWPMFTEMSEIELGDVRQEGNGPKQQANTTHPKLEKPSEVFQKLE